MSDSSTGAAGGNEAAYSEPKLSLFFGAILLAITAYFIYWGFGYTNHNYVVLFVLATLFGVFMAFNIGGNDVANSFGTSVGAGALTIKQALLVAAVFEISGAVIAGGEVTDTIRGGIVDMSTITVQPLDFIYIMMSALVAGALWLLFATKRSWPVSTTHSIIGAVVGSSITLGIILDGAGSAFALVQWGKIGQIAISWVLSHVLGGLFSYTLFYQIKKHILSYNEQAEAHLDEIRQEKRAHKEEHKKAFERLDEIQQISYTHAMTRDISVMTDDDFDPEELESEYFRKMHHIERQRDNVHAYRALQNWVPLIAALGAMIISAMMLFKGLKNLHLGLTTLHNYMIVGMIGAVGWMAIFIFAKTLNGATLGRATLGRSTLGRSTFLLFSWMQVFTAAGFAFSHGSNDIANAIGPFAAILDVMRTNTIGQQAAVPTVTMLTFGVALIVGLWFIGKEVIATVGHNLTKMHTASGFSAELSAAALVMIASLLGLPVSSTHILIGSVLGIGLVNHSTNWDLMKPIALAWVITLPAAAIVSAIVFIILRTVF